MHLTLGEWIEEDGNGRNQTWPFGKLEEGGLDSDGDGRGKEPPHLIAPVLYFSLHRRKRWLPLDKVRHETARTEDAPAGFTGKPLKRGAGCGGQTGVPEALA